MIGRTILHYQIVETLGRGGMGVVYKARDTHLDRFVAIKVLPPEKVADPERKRRFVQEAKAASALNHPNIVHIYDIAEVEGVQFIAMECVPGKTLEQRIGHKGVRLNEALKYAAQIADALAKTHSAGIVHRDLKPSNVMVTNDGLVKVLDFGLAKLQERTSGEFVETETIRADEQLDTASAAAVGAGNTALPTQTALTREGTILGTFQYMSPEQLEGAEADARTDVFAFGATLYEMLTGRKAFEGKSQASLISAIMTAQPQPLTKLQPLATPALEHVVAKCLAKDPEDRWQSARDTPPLYTSNKITLAQGFDPPKDAPATLDILRVSVGTDPGLALETRKGTGYYKVPSLKGVWYRGHYLHDGAEASLEEMFEPDRLKDTHVPGGFRPPGAETHAIQGHEFGLRLQSTEREQLIAFLRTLLDPAQFETAP